MWSPILLNPDDLLNWSHSPFRKISGGRLRLQGLFFLMAKRKLRSDAQQNRERILVVAKQAFAQSGANASLDEIAKQAGVGPGTLYRHFPSRAELLKAV